MRRTLFTLAALVLLATPSGANADPGDLDPSWSDDGVLISGPTPGQGSRSGYAAGFQSDGGLVIAGYADQEFPYSALEDKGMFVKRLEGSGAVDQDFGEFYRGETTDFGCGGFSYQSLAHDDFKPSLAILPDDSILLQSPDCLVKLRPDGTRDFDFSFDGVVPMRRATGFAVQGQHVLTASAVPGGVVVERLDSAGRIDRGYAGDGEAFLPQLVGFRGIDLATSGSTLVVGGVVASSALRQVGAVRLDANGLIDSEFGTDGVAISNIPPPPDAPPPEAEVSDLLVQPDGSIVLSGYLDEEDSSYPGRNPRPFIVRITPDGSSDSQFGDGGVTLLEVPTGVHALAIEPDGKLLAAGEQFNDACLGLERGCEVSAWLGRLLPDGHLDPTFGNGGELLLDLEGGDRGYELLLDEGLAYLIGSAAGTCFEGWDEVRTPCSQILVSRHLLVDVGPDFDADGISDDVDACPTRFAQSADGCPSYSRSIELGEVELTVWRSPSRRSPTRKLQIELSIASQAFACREPERTRLERLIKNDGPAYWRPYVRQPVRSPGSGDVDYTITDPKPGPYRLTLSAEEAEGVGHCEAATPVRFTRPPRQ